MSMKRFFLALFSWGVASMVWGQGVVQPLTLQPGWNAIYLQVSPEGTADDFFKAWPVPSVSVYNASAFRLGHRFSDSASEATAAGQPFFIWTREASGVSTVGQQVPADSVLVCFNNSGKVFQTEAYGVPAAPRLAWHKSEESGSLNYVGVSVAREGVSVREYFEGQTFSRVYRLGGTAESTPKPTVSLAGMGTALKDGDVVLLPGETVSEWSGVLNVSPQQGVDFGDSRETAAFSVRNDGTAKRTVTVAYGPSEEAGKVPFPEVQWLDETLAAAPEWKPWNEPLSRTLEPGETWEVALALDRSQFGEADAGKTVGGILTFTEDGPSAMRARIPLQAVAKAEPSSWPAGLWVATVTLNRVDRVVNKETVKTRLPSGGQMRFRLLLHVDRAGVCRLLQRVTLAGSYTTDGVFTSALYAGGAKVPTAQEITLRYSCVTLPTDTPVIQAASGTFGAPGPEGNLQPSGGLRFTYTIGANSASNPFRHPYHPDHDGKDWDFATPLSDGRDFAAYQETVKPETFSIDGQVVLQWDKNTVGWRPTENVSGTCHWAYGNAEGTGGLRHEGTIWASGPFVMERVSDDATLILQ